MKEEKGHTFWHKTIKTEEHSQSSWAPKRKVWFQKNDDTKLGALKDFELMLKTSELKALSKTSLERPLTDREHSKIMKLKSEVYPDV